MQGVDILKKLTYIQGAFVLTITNLVTGILAFTYRIYLSRALGAEGMGVFQLVLPLYTLLITLVSGGITTAVSKLIAEQYASRHFRNVYKTVRICTFMIGGWSFLLCTAIAFKAEFISVYILKDIRTMYSIIVFTPAVFFIALSAILRGYFFGIQNVKPPAVIDIFEKIVRLAALVLTTYYLLPYGIGYICAGAMLAMTAGEILSFVLLLFTFKRKKLPIASGTSRKTDATKSIMGKILINAIPLSISGALTTIMDMICAVIVPSQLRASGYTNSSALALYGELTGMAIPLLFFPFIIVISLAITLVPAVTQSYTSRNWVALKKKCNDSLMITSLISLGATAFFLVFPTEACRIFFNRPQAGRLLFWMALGCAFEYWQFTLFAILSGIGLQRKVLENSILNIIIVLICTYTLVPLPKVGIYGYIIGFNLSAIAVTIFNIRALRKVPQISINWLQTAVRPFICFTGLILVFKYSNSILLGIGITKLNLIITSVVGFTAYGLLTVITDTLSLKQLKNNITIK